MCDLTDDEQQIRDILEQHRGPANAITSGEIADRIGMADTEANPHTRELIRNVVMKTTLTVGASNSGYFVIESRRELRAYIRNLEQRRHGIDQRIQRVVSSFETDQRQSTLSEVSDGA